MVGSKSLEKIDAEWLEFNEKTFKGPPAGWISCTRYMKLTGLTRDRVKYFFRKQVAEGNVLREMFSEVDVSGRKSLVPHFFIVENKR